MARETPELNRVEAAYAEHLYKVAVGLIASGHERFGDVIANPKDLQKEMLKYTQRQIMANDDGVSNTGVSLGIKEHPLLPKKGGSADDIRLSEAFINQFVDEIVEATNSTANELKNRNELKQEYTLTPQMVNKLKQTLKNRLSQRFTPDAPRPRPGLEWPPRLTM